MERCEATFEQRSFLDSNGLLWMNKTTVKHSNDTCFYRCIHPINDFDVKMDEWTLFEDEDHSVEPHCDVVEVLCENVFNRNVTYKFMHLQVHEKKKWV